ncbi:MAG: cytochrome C [Desulfobacterales bacterium]|nr:cytochrome C [Desulfobacterales bacterium]
MTSTTHIRRFSGLERVFHLFLMVTFLIQSITGFSRVYITTDFGRLLTKMVGGYDAALILHKWTGLLMITGFLLHTAYLITLILPMKEKGFIKSLLGPDSLIPNLEDGKNLWQQILWSLGMGPAPQFERWTYLEKFDYWAVYWGMPLLAVTGLMAMFPLVTSSLLPGWALNIAVFVHRAEAVLATGYIFIVHFFMGHLRPTSFPMNEAMFSGSLPLEKALEEHPGWVERLKKEGKFERLQTGPPEKWYRALYYIFGYTALSVGIYLLVNGIIYSRSISLH